jgi:transcriptional regulator with XRE-family HTH domain
VRPDKRANFSHHQHILSRQPSILDTVCYWFSGPRANAAPRERRLCDVCPLIYLCGVTFSELQDRLRQEIRRRIDLGEFSGGELGRRAGFAQAHISNFVNGKRGLTLGGLDRVLAALGMTFYDLLDAKELARYAPAPAAASDADVWDVPMVSAEVAARKAIIAREDVQQMFRFPKKHFDAAPEETPAGPRKFWTRYVVVQSSESDSASLVLGARAAVAVVDRHEVTPRTAAKPSRRLFAVHGEGKVQLRFLQRAGELLLLRGISPDAPVEVAAGAGASAAATRVIGRIVYLGVVML